MSQTTEGRVPVGNVLETKNGNRYLVLPHGRQVYLGNADPKRDDGGSFVPTQEHMACVDLGTIGDYLGSIRVGSLDRIETEANQFLAEVLARQNREEG